MPDMHPEQGPIWEWEHKNIEAVMLRLGANYKGTGPGILRKIPDDALDEIYKIFEVTGGISRFDKIEEFSRKKAREMGMDMKDGTNDDYMKFIFTANSGDHTKKHEG
jgi:heterodisulfide reductase subunit C